ncbi:MAG: VWA domain-containing protein [Nitratireductor sp.]
MKTLKLLAAAAVCALAATSAGAAERAVIVLDASGSMWGQIDGKPKLEIARETLSDVLTTLPVELELGLMAYGHREKGNCKDIELIVEPAAGAAPRIAEAAGGLRFLGKTPLSAAVERAAEALRYTEDKATVVLITDGIETCNADPCALATSLEQSGVDFTAHVVGFGLSREEGRQVACLAENTGGKYIRAGDAAELKEALTGTVSARPDEGEKAETPPVALPAASVKAPDEAPIGSGLTVEWSGPADKNDYLDIVPVGYEETRGELSYAYVKAEETAVLRAPGEVGDYVVRYVWQGPDKRHVLASAPLNVVDSAAALIAPARVMAGKAFTVDWKGPGTAGDYVDIVPDGYEKTNGELSYAYTEAGNPARLKAPGDPGRFELRYVLQAPEGRKVLLAVPLEVTEAVASVAFPVDVEAGSVLSVSWSGPAADGDYVDLVPEGYDRTSGEIAYFYIESSDDGETGELVAPGKAGRYQVRYVLQAPDGRKVLTSQALSVTGVDAQLEAPEAVDRGGDIAVIWAGPNRRGDYLDLVPAGYQETSGELAYAYTDAAGDEGDKRKSAITAPNEAGAYELRYVMQASDGRYVLARRPITVR